MRSCVELTGGMGKYDWAINGRKYDPETLYPVRQGERVRLSFVNSTTSADQVGAVLGQYDGGMSERDHPSSPVVHRHQLSPDREQLEAASSVFALLSDPTRLHLLWLLAERETDVTELTTASRAARPAVSQHLAKLRLAGLVQSRKEGRRVVYSLRDGHLRRLVEEALNHADHRMTGEPWHS